MRELTVTVYDDLDAAEGGRTEAENLDITLSFMGHDVALDLNDKHLQALQEFLKPYLDAGHKPDARVTRTTQRNERGNQMVESREINRRMREFADEHDIRYVTESGKFYYSRKLRREFAAAQEASAA